ncbi:MAG: CinA family protein [Christensenella sp.]|nr:CinA family protein [Christensenella sp.]
MIENYKDYCVLKAFNLTEAECKECVDKNTSEGIKILIDNQYMDYSISIINEASNEITFNKELNRINDLLKSKIYSDSAETLEKVVIKKAKEKALKISCAESLTGGMISSTLVNVPGSSAVFYEGFVTYSSMAKVRRLHVSESAIETYGPVSEQVCSQMVKGLLANKEIQIAVSTTGCAGPDSDEFNTPVGKVFVGIGSQNVVKTIELDLNGDRETIRKTVTNIALYAMINMIENI